MEPIIFHEISCWFFDQRGASSSIHSLWHWIFYVRVQFSCLNCSWYSSSNTCTREALGHLLALFWLYDLINFSLSLPAFSRPQWREKKIFRPHFLLWKGVEEEVAREKENCFNNIWLIPKDEGAIEEKYNGRQNIGWAALQGLIASDERGKKNFALSQKEQKKVLRSTRTNESV